MADRPDFIPKYRAGIDGLLIVMSYRQRRGEAVLQQFLDNDPRWKKFVDLVKINEDPIGAGLWKGPPHPSLDTRKAVVLQRLIAEHERKDDVL